MKKGSGLEGNQHLSAVHEAVLRFYRAEMKQGKASIAMRDLLKCHMEAYSRTHAVDEIWDPARPDCFEVCELDLPQRPKRGLASPPTLNEARSQSPLKFDPYTDLNVVCIQSEFAYVKGAATFDRAKKPDLHPRNRSPGPGDYDFDLGRLKAQSPRVVFPRGRKADKRDLSPGPGQYTPRMHMIARH